MLFDSSHGSHTIGNRCDYETLAAALLDYLSALTNAGITPVVIVDGMQDTEKSATTVLRRRAQVLSPWGL